MTQIDYHPVKLSWWQKKLLSQALGTKRGSVVIGLLLGPLGAIVQAVLDRRPVSEELIADAVQQLLSAREEADE